ncbi:MAG: TRAP transporter permease [Synergistes jonesii]|uniref:TRAP transporter permease n=1 Tax=Synergistes jonesii TaxID=2754 RepID=UPI002A754F2D|nr:TRAP transporter permease [Synergistes jonesii]MDY2984248.1 TRAP transporter permease [Synergistes jonesii]
MDEIESKNESLLDKVSMDEAQVSSLVEKYDAESRYRRLTGWQGVFISLWLAAMSLFHLYTAGIATLPITIQRAVHLTFAVVAVYILFPASQRANKHSTPWYDWMLAIAAGCVTGYIIFFFNEIARRGAEPKEYEIYLGVAAIILVIEAGRRVVGNVLPCMSVLFLLYCYFGNYVPGIFQIRGYPISRIIQHMYLTPEGIFGLALGVSATFVIVFIIFGAYLSQSGGAKFFNELALAIAGNKPGGPAKVAVVASGLLGTINGSSVANVATTGTFTIPLMKRVGYPPYYAGAVEACASTGGQLMPPIMGAGAFIMSEFLNIPYLSIAAAAIIPAMIYYTAIFTNVHIRARKQRLSGIPKEELPSVKGVMKSDGHLIIPVIVIIVTLLMKYTPLRAGFIGVVSVILVSSLKKNTRMSLKDNFNALVEGARGGLGVALACALVGFIVGTSSLTSLGLTISNNIIDISGGKLLLTLVMAMVACLVLGMGLPTTANYIVCSTIIAPALVGMNVIPIAAHLFVFYFGIMADLTPPVCLAAFTGAGIAGASPAKTGITATRIALASYLLPYCFVYNPVLLLQNVEPVDLVVLVVSALLGVVALAGSFEGWFYRDMKPYERIVFGALALASIHHDFTVSVVSIIGIVVVIIYLKKTTKKTDAAAAA